MVVPITRPDARDVPYPLAVLASRPEGTVVDVGGVPFGGRELIVIAGPCAVETEEQVHLAARAVAMAGARVLRGGAFKPRTSPYAFQGLGVPGLHLLAAAGRAVGLPVVTEVLTPEDVAVVAEHADALQVGARNVQNFALLKALGRVGKPVLLKRGMSTTIQELLMAAEYVLAHGNPNVILCERGIRSFDPSTRNTLDLAAVPVLAERTHLPVVIDPSHGTGHRELVAPLAQAAVAAGADGLLIEVHPDPAAAWSDGAQSLDPAGFADLMRDLAGYAALEGRDFGPADNPYDPAPLVGGTGRCVPRADRRDRRPAARAARAARPARPATRTDQGRCRPADAGARARARRARRAAAATSPRGLAAEAVVRVFRTIVAETRALQEDQHRAGPDDLVVAG